jgi:hypothetical protein
VIGAGRDVEVPFSNRLMGVNLSASYRKFQERYKGKIEETLNSSLGVQCVCVCVCVCVREREREEREEARVQG